MDAGNYSLHRIVGSGRTLSQTRSPRTVAGEARSWVDPAAEPRAWVPVAGGGPRSAYEFVTRDGQRLTVSLTGEPVVDLRRAQPVATYVRARIRTLAARGEDASPARSLGAEDADRLESLEFRRGLALLQETGADLGMAPLSWRMAAVRQRTFAALNAGVRRAVDPRSHLIAELSDLPAGVDRAALQRTVAFVAERRRAVFVRLPLEAEALAAVAGSGVRGVCFAADGPQLRSDEGWRRFTALIHAALTIVPTVVLDRAPPERHDEMLAAGATHAVFARFTSPLV